MDQRKHATILRPLLAAVVLALAVLGSASLSGTETTAEATPRPNIIVIQTDDQPMSEFYATFKTFIGEDAQVMPRTLSELKDGGAVFNRYYVSYPLCCPSRTTLLTGRYAHSHGVISNNAPRGGFFGYTQKAVLNHNLAIWLQQAGYRTSHIGKFLNNYGGPEDPEEFIPPGWDDWQSIATDNGTRLFYGYELNVNGQIQGPFGDRTYDQFGGKDDPACGPAAPPDGTCNYEADSTTRRAVEQINVSSPGGPFYLQVDYISPHGDPRPPIGPEPAPRHYDSALNTPLPKPRGLFNEGNISDKPSFIRDQAPLLTSRDIRRIRIEYQKSLEALRSVDDGVGAIIDTLAASGELDNTYIFFTTDNGFFLGEHRIERAKFLPYEPATHVPLFVRGPGIEPGTATGELAANIDLAPTILELARARATRRFDGRSLVDFWEDPDLRTRRPILLESFAKATDIDGDGIVDGRKSTPRPQAGASISAPVENYLGVRIGPYKYVEYETGDRELYDLVKDPKELNSRVSDPRYDRVQRALRRLIVLLEGCVGSDCKIESAPLPPVGMPGKARR